MTTRSNRRQPWPRPIQPAPLLNVTEARGHIPDARQFFLEVREQVEPFVDARAWQTWCAMLDLQRGVLRCWADADPRDAARLYDIEANVDPYESHRNSDHRREQVRALGRVYEELAGRGIDVSQEWLRAETSGPNTASLAPMDRQSWQLLLRPCTGSHWMDLQENALVVLAAKIGLSAIEIANLAFSDVTVDRSSLVAFVDVRRDNRRCRSLAAFGEDAWALFKWAEHLRLFNGALFMPVGVANTPPHGIHRLMRGMLRSRRLRAGLPCIDFVWDSLRARRILGLLRANVAAEALAYRFDIPLADIAQIGALTGA
jgi:hypothetical protein